MNGNEFVLTFDIDWAPDYMIRHIADQLTVSGIRATWFITHDSPAVRELMGNPLFETGLHPNYLPGSSHGNSMEEVLSTLLAIAPDAVSVRSHAVVQSGALLNYYTRHTGIRIDSTTFLPEMPNIIPLKHAMPEGSIWRIPFFWADDYEMCRTQDTWNIDRYIPVPGLKVMMFHPVHIFLNSPGITFYNDSRKTFGNVGSLSRDMAERTRYEGKGTADFFIALIEHLEGKNTRRLCDLITDIH